jgi:DNA-binding MarR family transcriptional regulator
MSMSDSDQSSFLAALEEVPIAEDELRSSIRFLQALLGRIVLEQETSASHRDLQLARARDLYAFRRQRERIASAYTTEPIFSDPTWDILLDLYIHQIQGRPVSVSSCCIASQVAATTALRYIAALEEQGLIAREPHEHDKRSSLLRLTASGLRMMDETMTRFGQSRVNERGVIAALDDR